VSLTKLCVFFFCVAMYRATSQVTLSGLLNMVDGLWSSSGHERILIFTTTHVDRLDQALLRPGRMDMHVHMGYLGFGAFRELAATYHGVAGDDHPLFPEIEALLREVEVAPAEVAERLLMTDDAGAAIEMVAKLLRDRKAGTEEDGGGYVSQKLHAGTGRRHPRASRRGGGGGAVVATTTRRGVFGDEIGMEISHGQGRRGVRGRGRGRR
jgi:chaperone BCS1